MEHCCFTVGVLFWRIWTEHFYPTACEGVITYDDRKEEKFINSQLLYTYIHKYTHTHMYVSQLEHFAKFEIRAYILENKSTAAREK